MQMQIVRPSHRETSCMAQVLEAVSYCYGGLQESEDAGEVSACTN